MDQHPSRHRLPWVITLLATIAAWIVWWIIIVQTNPDAVGAGAFILFYMTLLVAVGGTATIIGLVVRRHRAPAEEVVQIAVRQGILIGCAVAVGAFLQSRNLLTWFTMVFLIAALTVLELFWISLRGRTLPPSHAPARAVT